MTDDPRCWRLPRSASGDALEWAFGGGPLHAAIAPLHATLHARQPALLHGDLPRWRAALEALQPLHEPRLLADRAQVTGLGGGRSGARAQAVRDAARQDDRAALMRLRPWRKGPFLLDGIAIDTEWRSDHKWDRLLPHIAPLAGRRVLDVGSGSGYHLWRMHAAGAAAVLGIEPMLLFDSQFRAVARYAPDAPVQQLPLRLEDLAYPGSDHGTAPWSDPTGLTGLSFDSVFSMGVLYHARDPHDHLTRLLALLRPGGQLVLDTLVLHVPGEAPDRDEELAIDGRYAGMRNIERLPSPGRLQRWLREAGVHGVRTVALARTSAQEQRSTAWSSEHSLIDVLAPDDAGRTRENHPAPCRAIVLGEKCLAA